MPRTNGLARTSVRFRPASFAGSFIALLFAALLVTMCGIFLESGLRAHVPPGRYADTPVVVAGQNSVHKTFGSGENKEEVSVACPSAPASTPARRAHRRRTGRRHRPARPHLPRADPHGRPRRPPLVRRPLGRHPTERHGPSGRRGDPDRRRRRPRRQRRRPRRHAARDHPSGESTLEVAAVVPGRGGTCTSPTPRHPSSPEPRQGDRVRRAPRRRRLHRKVAGDLRKALADADVKVRTGDGRGEVDHPAWATPRPC